MRDYVIAIEKSCVIKNCANVDEKKTKIKTKITPFPIYSNKIVKISVIKFECNIEYKMGKKSKKFLKSNPKHSSDEEQPEAKDKLTRDLKHGAAFIHPDRHQRRPQSHRVLVNETPVHQNPTVTSSADSTAVVAESSNADDELSDTENATSAPVRLSKLKSHVPGSHVPKLLSRMGLTEVRPTNVENLDPNVPNVEILRDVIQLPTHPEFSLFNLRRNIPNEEANVRDEEEPLVFRGYSPERLGGNPPNFLKMNFRESSDPAEESVEDLNKALEHEAQAQFEQEAPTDVLLSESQILDQSTNDLNENYDSNVNYDSLEFFNESGNTFEDDKALLIYLLECLKNLSNTNEEFREFFLEDDVLDENWPRWLEPVEMIVTYEQCYSKIIQMDINDIYNYPDPNIFQRMIYRGPEVPRIFEKKRRVLRVRPGSPLPGPSNAPDFPPAPEVNPSPEMPRINNVRNVPGYFSDEEDADKSLLIRAITRSEILSIQVDHLLGRPVPPGPFLVLIILA